MKSLEQLTLNQRVTGSSPVAPTNKSTITSGFLLSAGSTVLRPERRAHVRAHIFAVSLS